MFKYHSGKDDWVCDWMAERLTSQLADDFKPCSTLGIYRDSQIVAGVIFNNFRKESRDIHLTIAADSSKWASRGSLKVIFEYVFIQLGCIRLTVTIAKKNKRARKLAEGLGFQYEGKLRKGFDGLEDATIYGMLSEECRWIGERYEQKYTKRT